MTRKCFKNKNSYLFTQKSMVNFSIFLITTLLVTILIGQPSTAIISNSSQSAIIISQNSNQVNSNSSNSSTSVCLSEKEKKKTQNRNNSYEIKRGPELENYSYPTRGGKNTFKIVSPKTEETNNKPTISWCAVEGATSYSIFIRKTDGTESWDAHHYKKDPQSQYPNLLHLQYPNDEPHLESGRYEVTIQPLKNKEKSGSEADRKFTFSKSQNK